MKITHVQINNWTGTDFWQEVKSRPDERLIDATITVSLSWREYHVLIDETKKELEENE